MSSKKEPTPEQQAAIEKLCEEWSEFAVSQWPNEDYTMYANKMWAKIGLESPFVLVAESPRELVAWTIVGGNALKSLKEFLEERQGIKKNKGESEKEFLARINKAGTKDPDVAAAFKQVENVDTYTQQLAADAAVVASKRVTPERSQELFTQLFDQILDRAVFVPGMTEEQKLADIKLAAEKLKEFIAKEVKELTVEKCRNQPWFCGVQRRPEAAWYLGAQILGVQFTDQEELTLFCEWNKRTSCWAAYEGLCVVSRNPVKMSWEDDQLHCDDGMALEYPDGFGVYAITGIPVDEQIVMHPDTQTLEQIRGEQNEEVKRIRIERYGWENYLVNVGAETIEEHENIAEGTVEALVRLPDNMRAFIGQCPSTNRVYFLEVPTSINTCEQARAWMQGESVKKIVGAS